jgi:nitric oxide reductase large subunit
MGNILISIRKYRILVYILPVLILLPVKFAAATSLLENAQSIFQNVIGDKADDTSAAIQLTNEDIARGLKEALAVGSKTVTQTLGQPDGFNADLTAHIPLPDDLKRAQDFLSKIGLGGLGNEVKLKMNRAAEKAMEESAEILINAIQAMTLEDARTLLQGPDDAATSYLKRTSGNNIQAKIRRIMDQTLVEVGAIAAVDTMLSNYSKIPFVPDVKGDLSDHATAKAMEGLFYYIAKEEAGIRANPVKRTTDLLKKVFSNQ